MKPSLKTCNWKNDESQRLNYDLQQRRHHGKKQGFVQAMICEWSHKSAVFHLTNSLYSCLISNSPGDSKHILWVSLHQKLCQSFLQHVGDFTKHPKQAQCVCCLSMGNEWVSYQTQQPQIIHARSAKLPGKYWTYWHWIQALKGVAQPWSLRKVQKPHWLMRVLVFLQT